jgi:hypothetical protein
MDVRHLRANGFVRGDIYVAVMTKNYPYEEKRKIEALVKTLKKIVERDPEQEIQGIAVPVLDAVISQVRAACPDDSVIASIQDVISADSVALGEPIRAVDMLLVAEQLDVAIGNWPISIG